jgi:hypothetical protein
MLFSKWTVSPAEIVISAGSKTRFPLEPMITSTAHAGDARNSVAKNAKINFIRNQPNIVLDIP